MAASICLEVKRVVQRMLMPMMTHREMITLCMKGGIGQKRRNLFVPDKECFRKQLKMTWVHKIESNDLRRRIDTKKN